MGDAADAALEYDMLKRGAFFPEGPKRYTPDRTRWRFGPGFQQAKVWTMKDGTKIKLEEMTPRHRGNAIRLLERRIKNLPGVDIVGLYKTPLVKRMKELGIE